MGYRGNLTGCSNAAGNGCVVSYNVTNNSSGTEIPTFVGKSTVTAATGCWATSGMVVMDSGSGETGDQEVYFIQANTNGTGGVSGLTSSSCAGATSTTIGATQSLQTSP